MVQNGFQQCDVKGDKNERHLLIDDSLSSILYRTIALSNWRCRFKGITDFPGFRACVK
jgi:hypothetical protein